MFWNWSQEERIRNTYNQQLAEAAGKLEEGDVAFLHQAYCVFAFGGKELVRRVGRAIRELLEPYTMEQMIRLSETFRQYTSMDWVIDWENISLSLRKDEFEQENDYIYTLIVGSFHPNGYFREQCLFLLAEYGNTLPYLVLRMNDWVGIIREEVRGITLKKAESCSLAELFVSCQALDKVERSGRREEADLLELKGIIWRRIKEEIHAFPVDEIPKYEFGVRKSVYRMLFFKKLLDMDQADQLLDQEKHSFCQSVLISGILKHYDCPMEKIDGYLLHRVSCVRRKALEYKYDLVKGPWPGLEHMLLDTSRGIRELAAFILEKYMRMDIPGFYISHLKDENPVIPIIGLGETGDSAMAARLTPFLDHPSEKVVKQTILAIGRLAGEKEEELYWNCLFDQRVPISKAGYLCATRNSVRYGADRLYEEFKKSRIPHVKWYLALLILKENSWDRLSYVMEMYRDGSLEMMREKLLESMWKRNVYARVSSGKAEQIRSAVEDYREILPDTLVKEILFDLKFVATN